MATSNYNGAKQLGGILQNASGDNLTIIQQKNGVLKVKRITPKRKRNKQQ
jgi:hypothetical protein